MDYLLLHLITMPINFQLANDLLRLTQDDASYVASSERFQQNLKRFLAAFTAYYPLTSLGYSYKTNYLPLYCRLANLHGHYAEVVSGMEYKFALACGVEHKRIIFNGPSKKEDELSIALINGAMVNIDNLDELKLVERICNGHPDEQIEIGLRCNLGHYRADKFSRFGLNWETGQINTAAEIIASIANCTLIGLHCHSSYSRQVESYRDRAQQMIKISDELFKGQPPDYIDMGGGFSGTLPDVLRDQIGDMPSYEQYGATIASEFAERYKQYGPKLILEPGVGLVADTMTYICRVTAMKHFPDRNIAVTSGSIHHLKIVDNSINLPLKILSKEKSVVKISSTPTDIVGFTCLEHDVLFRNYIGPLSVGDILLFGNVGAYSFVSSPIFIRSTPPIYTRTNQTWQQVMGQLDTKELISHFSFGNDISIPSNTIEP